MQYADQAVRDAAIQRENERYEKALASGKKKTREPRNDEATRLLLQYSQQQAQVEGHHAMNGAVVDTDIGYPFSLSLDRNREGMQSWQLGVNYRLTPQFTLTFAPISFPVSNQNYG